jgi:hypothetical protein
MGESFSTICRENIDLTKGVPGMNIPVVELVPVLILLKFL